MYDDWTTIYREIGTVQHKCISTFRVPFVVRVLFCSDTRTHGCVRILCLWTVNGNNNIGSAICSALSTHDNWMSNRVRSILRAIWPSFTLDPINWIFPSNIQGFASIRLIRLKFLFITEFKVSKWGSNDSMPFGKWTDCCLKVIPSYRWSKHWRLVVIR